MNETVIQPKAEAQPRKLSRAARRQQLIEATIETIAARGYSRTTLTDVANQAGLSHGLVNFHFQTKERLLTETLEYLSDEYRANWTEALAAAPDGPAARLDALIQADFRPQICTPARLAAWSAFWGESQSRPLYQEKCASNDEDYSVVLVDICRQLAAEGSYTYDPILAARILRITLEGVWLDMMTMSVPYDRDEALRTAHACAAALFPRHFAESGMIGDTRA